MTDIAAGPGLLSGTFDGLKQGLRIETAAILAFGFQLLGNRRDAVIGELSATTY